MKKFLAAAFLLSSLFVARAELDVQYLFANTQLVPQGVKSVTLTPFALINLDGSTGTNLIVTGDTITRKVNAGGSVIISNLLAGSYLVEFFGATRNTFFTNSFGTNLSGLVNAADYLFISTNLPNGNQAYSMAAADARFAPIGSGGGGGVTNNQVLPGSVTASSIAPISGSLNINAGGGTVGGATANFGGYLGNGSSLTGLTASQISGLTSGPRTNVNNVLDFGATGTNNWPLDTAAFQSAFLASMNTNGFPVYFPRGIYGISNLVIDGLKYNFITNGAEFSGVRIVGDFAFSQLVPATTNQPIITLTNGLNNVRLERLNFVGLGHSVSANAPLIDIQGRTNSTDNFVMKDSFVQNGWLGIRANAFSDSHFENCSFYLNHCPLALQSSAEGNNNLFFIGGFCGGNDIGIILDSGNLNFRNVEGGNNPQFCMVLCTNTTSCNVRADGGNYELGSGAFVMVSNAASCVLTVDGNARIVAGQTNNPYLVDFEGTGTAASKIQLDSYDASGILNVKIGTGINPNNFNFVDNSATHFCAVEKWGSWTNNMGSFRTEITALGDISPGVANQFNSIFSVVDDGSSKHYSQPFFGVLSNGANWNIDLAQYWKDRATGGEIWSSVASPFRQITAANTLQDWITIGSTRQWRAPFVADNGGAIGGNCISFALGFMAEQGLGYPNFAAQFGTNGSTYIFRDVIAGYGGPGKFIGLGIGVTNAAGSFYAPSNNPVFSGSISNLGTVYGDPPSGTPVTLSQNVGTGVDWGLNGYMVIGKLVYGNALQLPQTWRLRIQVGGHGILMSNVCVKASAGGATLGAAYSASNRISFSAAMLTLGQTVSPTANQWFLTNGIFDSDPIALPMTQTNDLWFYAYLPNVAPNTGGSSGTGYGTDNVLFWNSTARDASAGPYLTSTYFSSADITWTNTVPSVGPNNTSYALFKALVK